MQLNLRLDLQSEGALNSALRLSGFQNWRQSQIVVLLGANTFQLFPSARGPVGLFKRNSTRPFLR